MSSSDSTHPPPLRSAHKSKIHITQFMAHVHVPSLPPSPRKSDCAPVKQRPRKRVRRSSGMGKAGAGDNSGLNDPMHLLQALATAFYSTPRIRAWHRRRRPQHKIRTDYGRGSTRRLRRDTRTESFRDSNSVEVVVTSPTKRLPQVRSLKQLHGGDTRVSPRRKGKRRHVYTPTTNSDKKRRRVAPRHDPAESDDSDDEIEDRERR